MSTPKIRLRGIRSRIPKGYILGRTSSGKGEVELLDLRQLRAIGVASASSVARNKSPIGFGFFIEGLMTDHELIGAVVFGSDVTFTDGASGTIVSAMGPAGASAALTLVVNNPAATTVGTITFAAGGTTGVVAWTAGEYTLPAGTQMQLYAPTPADVSLSDVAGTIIGARA